MDDTPHSAPTLRELYPGLSDEELRDAEVNLKRYVKLVLRIHERREAAHVDELTTPVVS